MTKPKSGNVFDHLLGITVHLESHLRDFVGDEIQTSGGLLEVVLPFGCQGKKALKDFPAEVVLRILREDHQEAPQCLLLHRRLAYEVLEHARDIIPKPCPSHLMCRVPIFGHQRPEGGQHHCLVLVQVHRAPVLVNIQRQCITLLLKSIGIRTVGHHGIEGLQDLLHPEAAAKAHDRAVEQEHLVEGGRHLHGIDLHRLAAGLRAIARLRLAAGLHAACLAFTITVLLRGIRALVVDNIHDVPLLVGGSAPARGNDL
mmetsp:Transcript_59495/g.96249  ORF Transcript_59495/g.96249 Transcript_59495/m.96249 type:complete len:257 (+) Transcript_59495:333-1103(+)